jgi:hypothetical protein
MKPLQAACGFALAFLAIAAAPAPLVEVRNANDRAKRIEARAILDSGDIRLSGEVKLTLTVEGPGPLGVTPSKPLLLKANVWRVREEGLPIRELLSNGRERWTHTYRLSPLVPGEPKVELGPIAIRPGGGQDVVIDWSGKEPPAVRVVTSIENPSVESLRPQTDIEQLPQPPSMDSRASPWRFAVVPALLLLSAIAIVLARRKGAPPAPRDAAWAIRELNIAELTADRCAEILRQYLANRFAMSAESRTTPELAAVLIAPGRLSAQVVTDWQSLLNECDVARFSGVETAFTGLADRAKSLVLAAETTPEADVSITPPPRQLGP